jgi:hypothetical protein
MDEMTTFRNQFLKECHPETHEMIMNAEHAFEDGEIDRKQRNEVIMAAIAAETERLVLGRNG